METRADWMIAAQACFKHNIHIVTVYATLGADAVVDALNESEVEVLISSGQLVNKNISAILQKTKISRVIWASFETRAEKIKATKEDFPNVEFSSYDEIQKLGDKSVKKAPEMPKPDSIAVIMYTSGTSGKPKGVLISQANMVASCSGIGERLMVHTRFSPSDTYIGYLPLAHILELIAEQCVLFNGCPIGYSSALTLSDRSTRIKKGSKGDASELRPTVMASVPEILERIRKGVMANVSEMNGLSRWLFNFAYDYKVNQVRKGRDTPILNKILFNKTSMLLGGRMRAMLSGGAPLEEKTQRFMEVCISTCVIGYGLTETAGGVAINDICEIESGRTGGVIDTGMVKLVEWKEGGYSPKNDPPTGEVYFGGPGVTQGYFKMPEKTAEDFITDEKGRRWFKTGDIGQFDPDGALRIIDRKKDLVKLRHGEYIALGKIEAALKTSRLVTNCSIFADSNEMTCVAVVPGNETELSKIAKEHGLTGDFSEWANSKAVNEAVFGSIREAAKAANLSKQEMPSKIYVDSLQWLPETGLITDAFKLKRKALNDHYVSVVASLYKK